MNISPPLSLSMIVCALLGISVTLGTSAALAQEPPTPSIPGLGSAKGPFSPEINPEKLWDGRKLAPFRSFDMPKMVAAADATFLDTKEYVLGVTVQGQSRAYPTRFIWWHHCVNDKVTSAGKGDSMFAVTYCSVCNSGAAYDLSLEGKSVTLDFYGLYNGVVALCDHETESIFLQASGKFVSGPLLGKELSMRPLLDTTWGEWRRLHPNTVVMAPEGAYSRYYRAKESQEPRGYDHFPAPFFRPTISKGDLRLPPFDKVLGVGLVERSADGKDIDRRRAYPMKALRDGGGVVNDVLGDKPIAVFYDSATESACAVSSRINGKTLTFELRKNSDGTTSIVDKETRTRWSIEGFGEKGANAGKNLDRIEGHLSQWYGWFAYFPETSIYGHNEPPQSGDPFATPKAVEGGKNP